MKQPKVTLTATRRIRSNSEPDKENYDGRVTLEGIFYHDRSLIIDIVNNFMDSKFQARLEIKREDWD